MVWFILIFCQIWNFLTYFLIFSFSELGSKERKNHVFWQQKSLLVSFSALGKGNDHFLLQRLKEVYIFLHELINTLFISMFTKRVTLVNDVHKTGNFLLRPRERIWSISAVPGCTQRSVGAVQVLWEEQMRSEHPHHPPTTPKLSNKFKGLEDDECICRVSCEGVCEDTKLVESYEQPQPPPTTHIRVTNNKCRHGDVWRQTTGGGEQTGHYSPSGPCLSPRAHTQITWVGQ